MKKNILTIIAVFSAFSAFSQVVITKDNFYGLGTTVSDYYVVVNEEEDVVPISSFLNENNVLDNTLESVFPNYNMQKTVDYIAPAAESTWADETFSFKSDSMRIHVSVSDEKAVCLGVSSAFTEFNIGNEMDIVFDEPMVLAEFPMKLNSEISSTAHGSFETGIGILQEALNSIETYGPLIYTYLSAVYDSILIDIQVSYNSNYNESGNITLSGSRMQHGTYEYLREIQSFQTTVSIFLHSTSSNVYMDINECDINLLGYSINIGDAIESYAGLRSPIETSSTTLNYWVVNENYPIVEITTDNEIRGAKSVAVKYSDNSFVEENEINVSIYPNPASNILNLQLNDIDNGTLQIISLNGEIMKEVQLNGECNSINISDLENGNYLYRVLSRDKVISGKFAKL
ncbi:MAG: T9SS type A sorting domain-containing protein [Bacteroidales bacterium]|nr:T9SS type A sorting domain-containing protein [Bacteroidales bacterium]